ncbi:hypothetical protein [Corynebacterium hiratae]|nr:hypothetical protein [Corynebacterium aurimucosum]
MKKLVTAAAALAIAASGLVACNDKKEEVDMKPSSEMMARARTPWSRIP